ncbi:tyrosine-type recombinase/integrase [Acidovorax sp. SRB_24]|uniref:tyrosine-type recombinase/integrase n=1 Tax=Acidovorax sp. SRB_24 TaxID=1962700 RepID=UPI00145C53D6
MTIKYTYPRGKTTIYQRAVPTDLRPRYPGATIKRDLKTTNPIKVARLVENLNRSIEAEWEGLRAAPESSPESLKAHADEALRSWGLAPHPAENVPEAISLLDDYVDDKRAAYAQTAARVLGEDEERVYREASAREFLTPVEIEALQRLHGKPEASATITYALDVHLDTNRKRDDLKFTTYARRAFASLVAVTGDKAITNFTRADARKFIAKGLEDSLNTATIRRRINSFRAVWSSYRRECDPQLPNPFEGLAIPGEGLDKKARVPFTTDELKVLISACQAKDDDLRWILAMLADTGARLAEVVGLTLSDIVLDRDVPHIIIQPHAWRSLKNAASARVVPLVGASFWAAKRVKETATHDQVFAFPRYTTDTECKATNASGTIASWIRRLPLEHTAHDLRHTMADRLKAIQCPKDIRYAIDGHAAQDVGDTYGTGYGLKVKAEWLEKVVLAQ